MSQCRVPLCFGSWRTLGVREVEGQTVGGMPRANAGGGTLSKTGSKS